MDGLDFVLYMKKLQNIIDKFTKELLHSDYMQSFLDKDYVEDGMRYQEFWNIIDTDIKFGNTYEDTTIIVYAGIVKSAISSSKDTSEANTYFIEIVIDEAIGNSITLSCPDADNFTRTYDL